jgi:hypothetical protein
MYQSTSSIFILYSNILHAPCPLASLRLRFSLLTMALKRRHRRLERFLLFPIVLCATISFRSTFQQQHEIAHERDESLLLTPSSSSHPMTSISTSTSKPANQKMAVVTLISNHTSDIHGVSNAIRQLHQHNIVEDTTPILIFHQGDLTKIQQQYILRANLGHHATHISFPIQTDFDKFPPNFNPSAEAPIFVKRSKWGYQHMCRFWISLVWTHPALRSLDAILRIDADSCFLQDMTAAANDVPVVVGLMGGIGWRNNNAYNKSPPPSRTIYHANPPIVNDAWPNHGLWEFVLQYKQIHDIQPKNPLLFALAERTWKESKRLPMFRNNLELDRLDFFQSPPVQAFQKDVVGAANNNNNNSDFYRYRWGDAPIRFLTLALFAAPDQLEASLELIPGYQHGSEVCGTEEIRVWKKIRAK